MANDHLRDFEAIKTRLEEIVEAVSDESIPLDDALDLYEEAVELGMRVSDVLEDDIVVDEEALEGEGAGEPTQDSESSDESAASQAANE